MSGWMGQILRIDLDNEQVTVERLDRQLAKDYIGARGLGTKLFYDEVDPKVEPLAPENKLIFATGPLTGTAAVSGSRYNVVTKSPLTGTIAASNSGGYFPSELKYAGYDAIVFEGKAEKPVYIVIDDDQVEIKSADNLWGKTTLETDNYLRSEYSDKFKTATIGPAGENLVKFACIMNDRERAAGRSGVGAVMGSKNLKAVMVRGTQGVQVANKDKFKQVLKKSLDKIKESGVTNEGLPALGTAVLVNIVNEHGNLPTRNFQEGIFKEAEQISGESLADELLVKNKACAGCPIGCGRVSLVPDGEYEGFGEGPEYETIWAFGADCDIDNLKAITKANFICNELGLDTITMGTTIACAMEMYEDGVLTDEEIGLNLEFGNAQAMVEAVGLTGKREGIGDLLAEGSYRLAERYGKPEYSMSTKKQEYPAYDPRGSQGMGLEYATSNRGGCHVRGYMTSPEILGVPESLDPFTVEGKAEWTKIFQDLTGVVDASGICLFTTFALDAEDIYKLLESVTGAGYTEEEMMQAGERIWNLERVFNAKAGIEPDEDKLAKRLVEKPMPEGPAEGKVVDLETMLDEYYELRGWSSNGEVTEEKIAELGI
ncbi:MULTISPECIES: aldehyde ferredoxin oxidoreductase family protein [unclassified Candidatus Frackibacter]|uniref:aldehyde ferredoxin oxidoreductase family protein n=1 Tax=unclassified Candidatus Frackibacter TaxID=2648818 RepID=UPI00088450C1|nr:MULTISPECIES: aldehyde ferredoxin oxidoreductase family protein [unclassified Candidatus Frackibacter]SDB96915.1 aldehyde:ferredoxin oxidoreductase [Candidatus Frackibacter sp. WG11]SEM28470.1 aldehyde:ferredoxin oxidoreductase [Candidatus Frackibacter sp. WG12]SFL33371.1 aldehyde:ferredoxin oxidoreductase [Candidatus Frackibacter sp. WG13]